MKTVDRPNGPAIAAILAGALGVFTIGLFTTLNAAFGALGRVLTWVGPVGPLSGKTGLGVIVWLVAWVILGSMYKGKAVDEDKNVRWAWIFIALGLVLTFPPVFDAIGELFK